MPQAHGDIAQLIERSIRIAEVEGLSPSISTNLWLKCSRDLEARQLQPDKYAARKWAILGIISRISIGDVIQYDLTLQRGGNHKDLRPLQDNERICRARRWNINSRYDHERLELRQTQLVVCA